ncbi:DUF2975 domain-containing protein [Ruminococcus flavefaciens]|jgi:hypothetical protein|uniref:DUF2975 domain-containing protein n=1 Tax=Ruminococcus flavefaciens TaxID=1265 RepID=UPI000463F627|nr:DUF2975 domain-containing protein [Ruminococcus flavefaciens]
MNKTISEKLKKRTFIDTILSCLLCFSALGAAVYQFIGYSEHTAIKEYLINSLYSLVLFAELGLLALILLEIRKTGKPFSKKIITKLRIMAVVLIAGALIPSYATVPISEQEYSVVIVFDMQNMLFIALGVIIGILSEVFVYGLSLQEDNDMIA